MTADLHDATLFYTVMGPTLDDEPDYEAAAAALDRAKERCAPWSVRAPVCASLPR